MYDPATIAALQSGALVLRDILTVNGKTNAGVAASFVYWTGEDSIAVNVIPAGATSPVSRNAVGGGTLLEVPQVVDAIGMEARSVTFGLDHIDKSVGSPMDTVFGNNVRVARVELHRAIFDPASWYLAATPHLLFAGRVDGAAVDDAAAGGQGGLSLDAINAVIDNTRTNPAMESDEQQRLREGDRIRRYGDTAAQIDRWWGQAKGSADKQTRGGRK
ncbi:hypothetical protein WH87_04700 [Devosia epidermidihirudinis]|uniref:Uncharacterized protein n=1 Tax=Devosia epidermidihirudinis TaxID=1293439 RepID=A0A0F5QFH9_9HYPH|nr:hypothetical protein [Devosia epidermidihirudinis]KKC39501.1 hypothetical protein WH87_04700 [Devosia epidermidihirudinis]